MDLSEILKQHSTWTWNIMEQSSELGEMIREDAITSVNIAQINRLAKANKIDLHTMSFQGAKLEMESGADWLWGLADRPRLAIQAKRLDPIRKSSQASYQIDIAQLLKLIGHAEDLSAMYKTEIIPYYVFYNSLVPELEQYKQTMGCTCLSAILLRNFLLPDDAPKRTEGRITLPLIALMASDGLQAHSWLRLFDLDD